MKKIGYVYASSEDSYVKEQIEGLKGFKIETVSIEKEDLTGVTQNDAVLKEVVENLDAGDELVVYELRCLGKSIIQLAEFLNDLKERNIQLIVVKKGAAYSDIKDAAYVEMILKIAEMEKMIIRERTTKGLQEARRKGRVGGRPKISEETIEQIRYLYNNNRYTLRQIAEECNISLGTAYKYVQER
ncbi:recombinase family protein [Vagococcus carniphilus]|uniref:recombinase family protein n=1 Tax=Vagococcus carniphilus TaxID=218144 RepID=UPI0028901993|nr:recombinase family protein [Vagococcus carniphilus]MDT2815819.1 recombinase family protein [Vagococcus carniphilus]MDT2866186.1 recombinase family protein [Vagococcus carniphilus]